MVVLNQLKGIRFLPCWFNVKFVLLVASLFAFNHSKGTHIVGGNFELLHLEDSTYQLTLIFYFDDVNGLPGAKEINAYVGAYKRSNNSFLNNYTLPLESESFTSTVSNVCENNTQLKIRIIRYSSRIQIPKNYFTNGGFYFSYESCCRNRLIKNIYDPLSVGMVYYLELKENTINSTPIWPTPEKFYGCRNYPLNLNFSAYDLDGDSLAYEMIRPLAGHLTNGFTYGSNNTFPGPYTQVIFLPGYTFDRAIAGNPSLGIDPRKGILNLTAFETGIFVFAVAIKEFRNGKLLSTTNKEFQLVIWDCKNQDPPVVIVKKDKKSVSNQSTLVLDTKDKNCLDVLVTSSDKTNLLKPTITYDAITAQYLPKSLTPGYPNDTLKYPLCLPICTFESNYTSTFSILVSKEECNLLTYDTLSFNVIWEESTTKFDPAQIPNIFTPNGDGYNDVFAFEIPADNCTQTFQDFEITNRWGERLYKTSSKKIHWSADMVSEGSYFYTLSFTEKKYKGFVHLLR